MKKRARIKVIIGALIALLISLTIVLVFMKMRQPAPPEIIPGVVSPTAREPEEPIEDIVPEYKARVAIVIDDMGYDKKIFRAFVALGIPITFSVLPGERFSANIADEARSLNYEIMLHLPMQPHSSMRNPGKGVILLAMTREEMLRQLEKDIAAVPHITGVNNHMGSLLTENRTAMYVLLKEMHKKGLFFLDSMTSASSVAYDVAKSLGIKSGRRDVFLDNNPDIAYIKGQIDETIRIAKRRGEATAIGHPRKETVAAIREKIADFKKEGIEFVAVSRLLD